ncbi:MAG: DNA gyrase inhibitor YacG [Pseudomonadota bacterium]
MSCPICEKPTVKAYQPFCSRRCADVDLGRWMNETYRIPSTEDEPFDTDAEQDTPAALN